MGNWNTFLLPKGEGFNFEDTQIRNLERIEKLMGVLAMATVHKIGQWRAEIKPIKFKRFKNGQRRPQYSYFRYGLDFIRESIVQIYSKIKQFAACVALISQDKMSIINKV